MRDGVVASVLRRGVGLGNVRGDVDMFSSNSVGKFVAEMVGAGGWGVESSGVLDGQLQFVRHRRRVEGESRSDHVTFLLS